MFPLVNPRLKKLPVGKPESDGVPVVWGAPNMAEATLLSASTALPSFLFPWLLLLEELAYVVMQAIGVGEGDGEGVGVGWPPHKKLGLFLC